MNAPPPLPEGDIRDLAQLVEAMDEALVVVDRGFRVRTWAAGAERLFGWSPSEARGQVFYELLRTNVSAWERQMLVERLQADGSLRVEGQRTRKDGRQIWVEASMVLLGRPAGILLVIRDVSERKAAERAVRDREARLAMVLQGNDDGFWDWHIPSGRVHFSPRWAAMLGYSLGEVEPHVRSWEKLVHPEDLERATLTLEAHLRGETESYACEHRMRHAAGHWVWILDRGKVVERDSEGKAVRAAGTHTDISARKQAEEALRATQAELARTGEQLRSMLAAMSEGVILLDRDGRIVSCNRSAERILGLTEAQMAGRASVDARWRTIREDGSAFPGDEHPAMVTLRTGRPLAGVVMGVRTPEGDQRWISISSEPLRAAPGEAPWAVVTTFTDVTAQRAERQRLAALEAQIRGR